MAIDRASAPDTTEPPLDRVPDGVQTYEKDQGFVIYLGARADGFPVWGENTVERDVELRKFWPTEPWIASAFASQIARYAAFPFVLEGAERTTAIYNSILQGCENGEGWQTMMIKFCTDLFTQSNGAFLELIRTDDDPVAPVVSMRHLDAARCRRTGWPNAPVIYWDMKEKAHLMQWYQVIPMTEMPSPNMYHRGTQLCVLDRILRAAQIMKAILQFKHEKVSGLRHHKIHLVGGFNQDLLDSTMTQKIATARAGGYTSYVDPMILAALRSDGRVTHEEIDLESLPPDFNEDVFMKYYIGNMALAWEDDYTSFFPLPGGNLGTAAQAESLTNKSKSKGPAVFMRLMEHKMNYYGVLPKSVKMSYGQPDPAADAERVQMFWRFTDLLKKLMEAGIITAPIAQLMLRDAGYLKAEYLTMLGQKDPTPQPVSNV